MAWKVFQWLIIVGFIMLNIHEKWTDNGVAAGVFGVFLAFIATKILVFLGYSLVFLVATLCERVGKHRRFH